MLCLYPMTAKKAKLMVDQHPSAPNPFHVGETVITRRGKHGAVMYTTPRMCGVQFWTDGPIRELPWTALVEERAYRSHSSTSRG